MIARLIETYNYLDHDSHFLPGYNLSDMVHERSRAGDDHGTNRRDGLYWQDTK